MKLRELMENVDLSSINETSGDLEDFSRELFESPPYGWSGVFSDQVKGYYIQKWLCTDTWVGLIAYFWNGEPLAISWQSARKSSEEFKFVSVDVANRLRDFIRELTESNDPKPTLVDLDEELGETYTVNWASELLVSEAFYEGEKVKIFPTSHTDYSKPSATWKLVDVEFQNGEVLKVSVENLHIPYHLRKEEEHNCYIKQS